MGWLVGEEGRGIGGALGHDPSDAARLRDRLGWPDAPRALRGHPPRERTASLPALADRPAADAERDRRPGARGRGGDPCSPSVWRARSTTSRRAMRVLRCWCASARRSASTSTANAPSASCTRRSNATAATASSRKARWRGSTARRRSTASGRAAATSSPRRAARRRQVAGERARFPRRGAAGQGRRPRLDRAVARLEAELASLRSTKRGRAASSRGWRSHCKRAC